MSAIEANIVSISRAIDFIEQNLREEIVLADVAEAAFYSLFHFCRMFNSIVHHTPYDYLMRRRLSESARELIHTKKKIIEIAFEYEFNSPETYTRAFKRMFGMQPSQWRKRGTLPARSLMPCLTKEYLAHLNQGDALKPVIETRDEIQLAGLMTLVPSDDDDDVVIRQVWEYVAACIPHSASSVSHYGVFWYPERWEHSGFLYMAAIEVSDPEIIPQAWVLKTLPAGEYVHFHHVGGWKTRGFKQQYIYHTWHPKSGDTLPWPMEIERYKISPPSFHDDNNSENWEFWLPLSI
jgi:AraC family transcriptional regulator